jgi:alpha-amylase
MIIRQMNKILFLSILLLGNESCSEKTNESQNEPEAVTVPFRWEAANIYFLLTDRFHNANKENDVNFERDQEAAKLRGFEGGDIQGITDKIHGGYFNDLGINAIWFTPVVEQIHGLVDEGTGATYGYHGYWTKDWTALDPNFGTKQDLANLVEAAHTMGIRVILDVVINHTGPVTDKDPVWPKEWVRTSPQCTYEDYESTVECTLVKNLPDIKTESATDVELPQFLIEKWEQEGRLQEELDELDAFFARTNYPRAPKFYIIKWITDYIREFGVDGFRVDTAKHTEAEVWGDLHEEAQIAFAEWKTNNSGKVLDDNEFYMVGEVYNYVISSGRMFDYGDRQVDFFDQHFDALINFEFKSDAHKDYESLFSKYDSLLHNPLDGKSVVNYISSHDDASPFDVQRQQPFEAATKLLLCPGATQVYYGDESNRALQVEGASGDANLRSFMNWEEIKGDSSRSGHKVVNVLGHWQKLGRFRSNHPAVGAGRHRMISENPYLFTRSLGSDHVVVGLTMPKGTKILDVGQQFSNNTALVDYYSGEMVMVSDGKVTIDTPFDIVLLGR